MSGLNSKVRCSEEYPALWRIRYSYSQRIVQSVYGTGEVETIGRQNATEDFDVIATTAELAQAAYVEKHKPEHYTRLTDPERICYIDASIGIGSMYGGRWV
jgi:hypothetical protein